MIALEVLLWLALVALAGTYALYPLSMLALSRLLRRPHLTGDELPAVTLVISAFNEAAVIRTKLENALALDYPSDRLQVLVISDASDDGTDEIVGEFAADGVTLARMTERGGKSRGLTRFVPEASGEIIVFSDANSIYDAAALRHLVRHFADPRVGYVVGHQRYVEEVESTVATSEGHYWDFEVMLKRCESELSSVVGGDGAIYAIRRELFTPLADEDLSDFVNPLQIVAAGYRGIFDPEAFCMEHAAASFEGEFRRKVRIVNRALRGALKVPRALDPRRTGWFAYQLLLHKVLRWFSPYLLALALAANLALVAIEPAPIYLVTLALQACGYLLAAAHAVPLLRDLPPVYLAYFFVMSNRAAMLGTWSVLTGKQFVMWRPERG